MSRIDLVLKSQLVEPTLAHTHTHTHHPGRPCLLSSSSTLLLMFLLQLWRHSDHEPPWPRPQKPASRAHSRTLVSKPRCANRGCPHHLYVWLARTYIYTVYDRIFGDFPAKNTVYIWFWPTLHIHGIFAGKSWNIRSYTMMHTRYFWQGNHEMYGHIRCIHGIFAGKSWNIRSYTMMHTRYFCRKIMKYTVIYGAYTVFLAGKSWNVRSYTVCIYNSGQPYTCETYGLVRLASTCE